MLRSEIDRMSRLNFKRSSNNKNQLLTNGKIKALVFAMSTITLSFVLFVFQYDSDSVISDYIINTSYSIKDEFQIKLEQSSLGSLASFNHFIDTETTNTQDIKSIPYEIISKSYEKLIHSDKYNLTDWSQYAYATYSTNNDYLKSAILNAKRLRDHKVKADIVILYANHTADTPQWQIQLQNHLIKTSKLKYLIKFIPVSLLHYQSEEPWWEDGFTKFHVFGLTQYKRVIYFDADCLMYDKIDELLLTLPEAMIYAPTHYLAYRDLADSFKVKGEFITGEQRDRNLENLRKRSVTRKGEFDLKKLYNNLPSIKSSVEVLHDHDRIFELTDYFFVLEPNKLIYQHLIDQCRNKTSHEYDMDIFNKLVNPYETIKNNVFKIDENTSKPFLMVLPHNPYGLVSGEFKFFEKSHLSYLADPQDLAFFTYDYSNINSTERPYWSYEGDPDTLAYGWSSNKTYSTAKSIHFSDYPVTKPWTESSPSIMKDMEEHLRSQCRSLKKDELNKEGCSGVETWFRIYKDYVDEIKGIL